MCPHEPEAQEGSGTVPLIVSQPRENSRAVTAGLEPHSVLGVPKGYRMVAVRNYQLLTVVPM